MTRAPAGAGVHTGGAETGSRRRGSPVLSLALVLAGWIALRTMALALPSPETLALPGKVAPMVPTEAAVASSAPMSVPFVSMWLQPSGGMAPVRKTERRPRPVGQGAGAADAAFAGSSRASGWGWSLPPGEAPHGRDDVRRAPAVATRTDPLPAAYAVPAGASPAPHARWSGDAWFLLRRGSSGTALAAGLPAYGGSQAGGVLRYRIMPQERHRLTAYLRATGAVRSDVDDRQLALGLSARPVPTIPVSLLVEGRLQQGSFATRLRPSIAAVTELPPITLPLGLRSDVYAQAGWVGGAGATPFFDAQAVVDRALVPLARGIDLRAGGGVWSGGQKGAVRLDLGPRAGLVVQRGRFPLRLSADWRFRVAGQAAPGSGPALTLATGF
ncbi:hypothetical protein [Novosphingobium sp.]|uniref:hypothetical protein n=1 Tax=Novosphingobium sp. TaxID=1874826 RepID=UPI00352B0A33